ncbi:MAG: double-strand break repair protein AddB [Alphaproteobacteria bacterium]|nr:double-strand break repair protein AddB [Alphaproteobacteria bacterium]
MSVLTIPPGVPFLEALASGILARASDPLALPDTTILLPTRRAGRELAEAFLRQSEGRALLLPRLVPLGDVDAAELDLGLASELGLAASLDLPPAIAEPRRQLLLTRLILRAGDRAPHHAARLARELARLLDQIHTEGLSFADLPGLVPAELAEHWQLTLKFLEILSEEWPRVLEEEGALDPADRRARLLRLQAEAWTKAPPATPVIVAGSTGSLPATAALIEVVAALPRGEVVLPGLDRACDDRTWEAIGAEPTHPQHTMHRLLARLAIPRDQVEDWRADDTVSPRAALLQLALTPAATSDDWRGLGPPDSAATSGLSRLDLPTAEAEARAVALVLREALETSGQRAMLVTPDRGLGRRVAAEMARWNIDIDDSGGQPLSGTPPGTFLRLLLEAAEADLAPVPLLALLKHPLASGGREPAGFRDLARRLERAVLRGPRPAPGIDGLIAALGELKESDEQRTLSAFVADLGRRLAPLRTGLAAGGAGLTLLLAAHVETAEAMAAAKEAGGAERLWRTEAGEALANALAELGEAAGIFALARGADYPALYTALTEGLVVRPQRGQHPRLAILGPLEARLQTADVVVLAGLNEGTWPPEPANDPWLSRPMRATFGLPPPERRIGLSAHDFVELAAAPRVVLTRAERVEGTPTIPSRWLLRLDVVLGEEGGQRLKAGGRTMRAWADALDLPERTLRLAAPEPRPPVAARPTGLSVTQVETWMRDPYAVYARHILGLKALDPLDADPGAAERGQFIHDALDRFVAAFPDGLPDDAREQLLAIGRTAFGAALDRPGVRAFWWPRFERIADWFLEAERARRPTLAASRTEITGSMVIDGFRLSGKVDRIDRLETGGLVILDYKTGVLPSPREVELGLSPQLPLEALIAEAGGFDDVGTGKVVGLEYWRLSGGDPPGEIRPLAKGDPRALIDEALTGLRDLIRRFADPETPYRSRPDPDAAPRFSDYDHLARVKEWSTVE